MLIRQIFIIVAGLFTAAGAAPPPGQLTVFDLERTIRTDGSRGPFRISDRPILAESERVWVRDSLLVRDLDYEVDCAGGVLLLARERPRGTRVLVRFRQLPQVLPGVYRRRERNPDRPPVRRAPARRRSRRAIVKTPDPYGEAISRLDVGGAKRIQVTVGGNRDLELSQALRVQLSGQMADGVEVTAMLSDRNLPLGLEGGTRNLQELDRVRFQVRSRRVSASLGDLDVEFRRHHVRAISQAVARRPFRVCSVRRRREPVRGRCERTLGQPPPSPHRRLPGPIPVAR